MIVSRPLLSASSCLCVLLACKPEPATQAPEPTAPPVATTDPAPLDPGPITEPHHEPSPGATGEPPTEPADPPVATTNPPSEPTPVATSTSEPLPTALHTKIDSKCGNDPGVGEAAKPFTLKTPDGKEISLANYRGKVVLLNFWASWCNVCKAEKPSLTTMTEELAGPDFKVVTLASDRSWDDVKKALPKGAPFQVLLDPPPDDDSNIGAIATAWGIKAVPESFVIDKQGRIRMYLINKRDWDASVTETCLQALIDE